MPASAAVIDLQEFRARRSARAEPRPAPITTPMARSVAPFWIVWVPVWPVR